MTTNAELYLEHLDASREAVEFMAEWFRQRGVEVEVPEETRMDGPEEYWQSLDGGDLFPKARTEVKRLSRDFTSADDWPFQDFIVCARKSFDHANPKPWRYIYLNPKMTHFACVSTLTFRHWTVEARVDRRYEDWTQDFYVLPRWKWHEHVYFSPL